MRKVTEADLDFHVVEPEEDLDDLVGDIKVKASPVEWRVPAAEMPEPPAPLTDDELEELTQLAREEPLYSDVDDSELAEISNAPILRRRRSFPGSSLATRTGSSIPANWTFRDLSCDVNLLEQFPPKAWADKLMEAVEAKKRPIDTLTRQELAGLVNFLGAQLHQIGNRVSVMVAPIGPQTEAEILAGHLTAAEPDTAIFAMMRTGQVSLTKQLKLFGYIAGRDYEWLPDDPETGFTAHEREVMEALLKRTSWNEKLVALRKLA